MKLLNSVRDYLFEKEFKINIVKNKVNIINYSIIDHLDNKSIIVKNSNQTVSIKGEELVVTRLAYDEMLIEGNIKLIELR